MKVSLLPTERPPAFGSRWITCRVCELRGQVPLDNEALLCQPCRVDLLQTRVHVEGVLASVEARWRAAIEAWEALYDGAAPEIQQKWDRVQELRLTADPVAFARAWSKRKAEGGAFGALLEARERLDELSEELTARRAWADAALREIEACDG